LALNQCIIIAEKERDDYLLLKSMIVLSACLGETNPPNLDSASLILQKAIPLAVKMNDTVNLAKCYINLSNVLFLKEDYEQGLAYNNLCENLLKNTNLNYQKAQNIQSKGNNLFQGYEKTRNEKLLIDAKESYREALKIYRDIDSRYDEIQIRMLLGNANVLSGDYREAEKEYMESIQFGLANEDTSLLINGYYNLSNMYELEKEHLKSNVFLEKLLILTRKKEENSDIVFIKDQFSNKESSALAAFINYQIENNTNNHQINLREKIIQAEKNKIRLLIFAFIILVLVAVFFII
jgi:tetratricopeptide (TPR) repeat protein